MSTILPWTGKKQKYFSKKDNQKETPLIQTAAKEKTITDFNSKKE